VVAPPANIRRPSGTEERWMMLKVATVSTIALLAVNAFAAPQRMQANKIGQLLLRRDKPSVYISFIRVEKIEPLEAGISNKHIRLRITNNTRWPIWLDASDVPNKKYGDIYLYHTIESINDGRIVIDSRCHVCSNVPLASGKSWIFVVPFDYLDKDQRIRINFSFDWEVRNDALASREAEHSIFFYSSNLPDLSVETK
jgi:hypothetical protein